MKKNNIITIIALAIIIFLLALVGYGYYKKATMEVKNPIVTMEIENMGTIKLELYPELAPETVANFVALAKNGYYDGLTFHRVVEGFMVQGGDSKGDGTGSVKLSDLGLVQKTIKDSETGEEKDNPEDRDYCITGEFFENGYKNTLKHTEGVISMAKDDYTSYSSELVEESYNSAGGQFFIMTSDNNSLDGYYAAFGKVIEGLDVVKSIEKVEIKKPETEEEQGLEASTPVNPPVITKVTVETYGVDFGMPETLEAWDYYNWLYEYYGIDMNSFQ